MQYIDPTYQGRPCGGLSMLVKKNYKYTCREIEVPNTRVLAIELNDSSGSLIQVISCIYMPFYYDYGCVDRLIKYVDTVDVLQSLVDKYGSSSRLLFAGDFNTQLPRQTILHRKRYNNAGFTKYSNILFELW